MSLELALQENTAAIQALAAIYAAMAQSAGVTPNPTKSLAAPYGTTTPAKVGEEKKSVKAAPADGQPTAKDAAPAKTDAAPTPTAASVEAPAPASTAVTEVTYEDVKTLVLKVSKDKGRDAAAGVLAGFGVAKAPELKPEQYADAVAQLQAVLA